MQRRVAPAFALLLAVTACGAEDSALEPGSTGGTYPVTLENCGAELTFDEAPRRLALMETAPVTILDELGVLDRVVVRAGEFPVEYYGEELNAEIDEVESLAQDLDASGHFMISQEEIAAHSPDLIFGLPEGMTREGLLDAGAQTLIQELECPETTAEASYETVYAEIETYGEIFDRPAEAEEMVQSLQERVEAAGEHSDEEDRTAAVLWPSVGGGPLYAYGSGSMAHPQLETLGFENVFGDSEERVFEVQTEELVGRSPEVLVLLHSGDVESEDVMNELLALPGAETIAAVEEEAVLTHLFNYTEPATPLSVDGLELIAEELQD